MKTLIFISLAFLMLNITTQAGNPKLHPVKEMCVHYELTGQMQNGSQITCHRDYGYEKYDIMNITIGVAGFTQSQNTHNITIGETIYAIDLDKNSGTKTSNPMYHNIASAMEGKDPDEMSDTFIASMGYQATGESKNIADHECNVYSGQLGTLCLTENGIMLEQSVMGNSTIATEVTIGASGDDENYSLYEHVSISEGPDLSNFNLQDLMNSQQN